MIRIARKHPRITINPAVMVGKPCIKGTRIPVDLILRKLAADRSPEDLLEGYLSLDQEDIWAAVDFAADIVADRDVVVAEA